MPPVMRHSTNDKIFDADVCLTVSVSMYRLHIEHIIGTQCDVSTKFMNATMQNAHQNLKIINLENINCYE